jgi:hypothetical protein
MSLRSYTELSQISDFLDRYRYLECGGTVGEATFGHDRWMNQLFYSSAQWRDVRHYVRARDEGLDLGVLPTGHSRLFVHHMNPMTPEQIAEGNVNILDPEFLITCTHRTHNAIHYGDENQLPRDFVERRPGDTKLW